MKLRFLSFIQGTDPMGTSWFEGTGFVVAFFLTGLATLVFYNRLGELQSGQCAKILFFTETLSSVHLCGSIEIGSGALCWQLGVWAGLTVTNLGFLFHVCGQQKLFRIPPANVR